MPTLIIIVMAIILPLFWDILTILYLSNAARNGMLTPLRFSIVFMLGFGFTISVILFIVITISNGFNLKNIGFVIFVFFLNLLIGFPATYFFSKILFWKKFTKWSSKLDE